MAIDAATALRELGVHVAAGADPGTWLLRREGVLDLEVSPALPVARIDTRTVRLARGRHRGRLPLLHIGDSATPAVVARGEDGELDLLICDPPRLIYGGVTLEADPATPTPPPAARPGRPAWGRWAVMRYLVLADTPARQVSIASSLGLTQQAVSLGLRSLGDLVAGSREGTVVTNRAALLDRWLQEYAGPGGHEIGWYSLEDPVTQVRTAYAVAHDSGAAPMASGDVAADLLAPWQLPRTARLYVDRPVDLAHQRFVAAPLEEASLILCGPRDPTLWRLAEHRRGLLLADPLVVLWDLIRDPGAEGAAERLRETILRPRSTSRRR